MARLGFLVLTALVLAWILVLYVTGGFVLEFGGLRISSRNAKRLFLLVLGDLAPLYVARRRRSGNRGSRDLLALVDRAANRVGPCGGDRRVWCHVQQLRRHRRRYVRLREPGRVVEERRPARPHASGRITSVGRRHLVALTPRLSARDGSPSDRSDVRAGPASDDGRRVVRGFEGDLLGRAIAWRPARVGHVQPRSRRRYRYARPCCRLF